MSESANESIQIFLIKMNGKELSTAFYTMNEVIGYVKEQVTSWFTFAQPFYEFEKPLDDLLQDAERELLANNRYEVFNKRLEKPVARNINDLPEIAHSLFEVVPLSLSHYKPEPPKVEPKEEEPKEAEPKTLVKEIVLDKETVEKIRMALVADDMETYLGAKEDYVVGTATFSDGAYAVLSVQVRPLASDLTRQECGVFAQVEWYHDENDTCNFCETQLDAGDNNIVREYTQSYGDKEGVKRKLIVKLKED